MKHLSRRNFISHSGKAAIAGTVLLTAENDRPKEMKNIFVHHVYFWLKNPDSKEDLDKLVAGLKKLAAVKKIRQFHIGKPAATSRSVIDGSYAISWFTLFDNKTDQDSYQTDPIHLNFVEECSPLWQKVIVYDSIDI